MAGRNVWPDKAEVVWGLPELARFFIVSVLKRDPPGTLYQHCSPKSLDGLYTHHGSPANSSYTVGGGGTKPGSSGGGGGGWDRSIIYGNFLLMQLKFWQSVEVQEFVRLCLESGGTTKHRWVDQAVEAMVWQLFVPPKKFILFTDAQIKYKHRDFVGCEEVAD